jgi:hypothetical protein
MIPASEWKKAEKLGKRMLESPSCAVAVRYWPALKRIVVTLRSGLEVALDPARYDVLQKARPSQLREIEISPLGDALYFPKLDEGLSLPGVLMGITGTAEWMRQGELQTRPKLRRKAA